MVTRASVVLYQFYLVCFGTLVIWSLCQPLAASGSPVRTRSRVSIHSTWALPECHRQSAAAAPGASSAPGSPHSRWLGPVQRGDTRDSAWVSR